MLALCLFTLEVAVLTLLLWLFQRDYVERPMVIVISIDALGYDLLWRPELETLRRLGNLIVSYSIVALENRYGPMIAQFPTFTFANHFSIVTGLYPAFHGIVGNVIYDSERGRTFSSRNVTTVADPFWWLAEPVHKVMVT